MNTPIRTLRDDNGKPLLDSNGKKQHTVSLEYGATYTVFPSRKARRTYLQKNVRNPFYGIHMNKYIQVVPEIEKTKEGVIFKLGKILGLNKNKKNISYTGKVKVIDHYNTIKNRI